ncbi:hypothetical protein [Ralstonia phage RSP15]|uniref:hypothetical protein n=1 Tax=Ralstonia phage RSP15 TaxID=1785960 RepID=UPI00074D2D03|nr:hypothetical protein BH754_gp137 [Ralstonia phage RSP15]BAU40169.1 hypothetical protein [Ralstonia phage RSP15]
MRNDVAAVVQSVKNLVTFVQEDVVMNPEMYGGINNALFELKSGVFLFNIKNKVTTTIKRYEPRVELKELNVLDGGDPNSIRIELIFYLLNEDTPITDYIHIKRTR